MSETKTTEFTIGTEVACSDGVCGDLKRVVVDPVARELTHLVVVPKHGRGKGRLVPIDLVESKKGGIRLRCDVSQYEALLDAEETEFLPGASGRWDYEQGHMLSWPYYTMGGGGIGMGGVGGPGMGGGGGIGMGGEGGLMTGPQTVTYDRVPVGEVLVRRGGHVHATDGAIGRVQGLIIDSSEHHHVTHVLLDEGHLWGRKRVAIPISAVVDVKGGVKLNLTKDEVGDLPPVELD